MIYQIFLPFDAAQIQGAAHIKHLSRDTCILNEMR